MALGIEAGGEQTAPLGRAVIGGLLLATAASLTVLPCVFAWVHGHSTVRSSSLDPDDPAYRQGREAASADDPSIARRQ